MQFRKLNVSANLQLSKSTFFKFLGLFQSTDFKHKFLGFRIFTVLTLSAKLCENAKTQISIYLFHLVKNDAKNSETQKHA